MTSPNCLPLPEGERCLSRASRGTGERAVALLFLCLLLSSCEAVDTLFCDTQGCFFSADEWKALQSISGLPETPPDDRSNKFSSDPAAAALGQALYFDARFSGPATLVDTLGRPVPYGRAAKGQPTGLSCASCHDPRRGGADFSSSPNHVSIGAGWYDVNSQPTVNSAFYKITYWNGRNDSLWAQIVAVAESEVSMASSRLQVAWVLNDHYRAPYDSIFREAPLPLIGTSEEVRAQVDATTGQCTLVGGACPSTCRQASSSSCWPRFPLQGKPGAVPGCQPNASEPFHDAFDCMADADRNAINRVFVNYGKALAAYEHRLVSRDSAFDRFVAEGPQSEQLTPAQKRGARLFVGKASCLDCHNTPLMSDSQFHNIGVPQQGPGVPTEADCTAGSRCDCVAGRNCLPWGAADGLAKLRNNQFRRDSVWSDDPLDNSRLDYLQRELGPELVGAWRTPSLRDVDLTAPYMHDGFYRSLEEVVWAYNIGGAQAGFSGKKAVQLKPLLLTDAEQADLVAFLRALNGAALPPTLTSNPRPIQ